MKSIKKFVSLLLVLAIAIFAFASCGKTEQVESGGHGIGTDIETIRRLERPVLRIGSLTGPTTIGLVKLLDDADADTTENLYYSTLAGSADELTPLLIKGELDAVAGPANLAAVLYAKTEGRIQMIAVTALGVLDILSSDANVQTWEDLKGRTIYATGKGSTPEYNLRYLLTENGLDPDKDVNIEFRSEPAEILALYSSLEDKSGFVAMFPQPYAAVAQTQNQELRQVFDLSEEWDRLGVESRMITACLMVRKEYAEENPKAIGNLISEFEASANWVNSNTEQAAELTEKYIGIKAGIAKKAIPLCNIVSITGSDMKEAVSAYFRILYDQNPSSVGGALPSDDFYYSAE